jgi:hypothetical protein
MLPIASVSLLLPAQITLLKHSGSSVAMGAMMSVRTKSYRDTVLEHPLDQFQGWIYFGYLFSKTCTIDLNSQTIFFDSLQNRFKIVPGGLAAGAVSPDFDQIEVPNDVKKPGLGHLYQQLGIPLICLINIPFFKTISKIRVVESPTINEMDRTDDVIVGVFAH